MKTCYRFITAMALALAMISLSGCERAEELVVYETESGKTVGTEAVQTEEETEGFFYIYVCGEVNAPGVYKLPAGGRIYEAIEMAGGLTEEAAETYVNQAEILEDGQKVYIPSREEAEASPAAGEVQAEGSTDGKVNLNTASKEELMELPGIGASRAEDIIAYREEHGGFDAIDEVKHISGIKDAVFAKIKDMITVR